MMTLERWLSIATRRLSIGAVLQVEKEIGSHFSSAVESGLGEGLTEAEAIRRAMDALGDPQSANRAYRNVLLTGVESHFLAQLDALRLVRNPKPGIRWTLFPLLILWLSVFVLKADARQSFPYLLCIFLVFNSTPLLLPVLKAEIIRWGRWIFLVGCIGALLWFGERAGFGVLIIACVLAWMEWMKASIRRKLPREQWPLTVQL